MSDEFKARTAAAKQFYTTLAPHEKDLVIDRATKAAEKATGLSRRGLFAPRVGIDWAYDLGAQAHADIKAWDARYEWYWVNEVERIMEFKARDGKPTSVAAIDEWESGRD